MMTLCVLVGCGGGCLGWGFFGGFLLLLLLLVTFTLGMFKVGFEMNNEVGLETLTCLVVEVGYGCFQMAVLGFFSVSLTYGQCWSWARTAQCCLKEPSPLHLSQ